MLGLLGPPACLSKKRLRKTCNKWRPKKWTYLHDGATSKSNSFFKNRLWKCKSNGWVMLLWFSDGSLTESSWKKDRVWHLLCSCSASLVAEIKLTLLTVFSNLKHWKWNNSIESAFFFCEMVSKCSWISALSARSGSCTKDGQWKQSSHCTASFPYPGIKQTPLQRCWSFP